MSVTSELHQDLLFLDSIKGDVFDDTVSRGTHDQDRVEEGMYKLKKVH